MIGESFTCLFSATGSRCPCLQELSDYSFPRNKRLVVEFFLAVDGRETVASMVSQLGETVCV